MVMKEGMWRDEHLVLHATDELSKTLSENDDPSKCWEIEFKFKNIMYT